MACKEIAARMIEAVESGSLRLIPEVHAKIWHNWLANIQDWCISRQLWWGHQIPAYRVVIPNASTKYLLDDKGKEKWYVGRSEEEVKSKIQAEFPSLEYSLERDEDVLDTWFSSALLPFANFGWPDVQDVDFNTFFPNTILETGYDILFFWVARMVMMSLLLTDRLPFKTVYLHNIIRDENGEKMTKSKGNVIDPLEIIDGCEIGALVQKIEDSVIPQKEKVTAIAHKRKAYPNGIPKCGADALRFSLLSYISEAKDINLDIQNTIGYRTFCNKIWNAYKLFRMTLDEDFIPDFDTTKFIKFSEANQWILKLLD